LPKEVEQTFPEQLKIFREWYFSTQEIEEEEEELAYCSKLIYRDAQNKDRKIILLGLVENESDKLISFRTKNRVVLVAKELVLSLESTKEVFEQ